MVLLNLRPSIVFIFLLLMKGFINIIFLIVGLFFGIQFKDEIVSAMRWMASSQNEFANKIEKGDISDAATKQQAEVATNIDATKESVQSVAKEDSKEKLQNAKSEVKNAAVKP